MRDLISPERKSLSPPFISMIGQEIFAPLLPQVWHLSHPEAAVDPEHVRVRLRDVLARVVESQTVLGPGDDSGPRPVSGLFCIWSSTYSSMLRHPSRRLFMPEIWLRADTALISGP